MKRSLSKRARDRYILSVNSFDNYPSLEDYLYDIACSCTNFGYVRGPMEMFRQYQSDIDSLLNEVSSGSSNLSKTDIEALQLVRDKLIQFILDYQKLANEFSSDLKSCLGEIYYPRSIVQTAVRALSKLLS